MNNKIKPKRTWAKKGDKVKILDRGIFCMQHRKNWCGEVVSVNGGYIYVRPYWKPHQCILELYYNEIKLLI